MKITSVIDSEVENEPNINDIKYYYDYIPIQYDPIQYKYIPIQITSISDN